MIEHLLFKILDASIPALGGIVFLLMWLRIIPVKKNAQENEAFCQKYSKLMLVISIILLLFAVDKVCS